MFHEYSGDLTPGGANKGGFPARASKLFVFDVFICHVWQALISQREEYCCLASSIKSLCSCNHGSETVRSHSDNQNKTPPTAAWREARYKAASKENYRRPSVYGSLSSLKIMLLRVTRSCGYLLSRAVKTTVLCGHWNYPIPKAFRAGLRITYDRVQVHSNHFPAGPVCSHTMLELQAEQTS